MRAGFSPLEALVNVSMQPSVLKAAVLSYAELSPGQQLTGTVCMLPLRYNCAALKLLCLLCSFVLLFVEQVSTVDDYGVLVALGQGIRGLVTTSHLSDLQATSSSKKACSHACISFLGRFICTRRVACTLHFAVLQHHHALACFVCLASLESRLARL